MDLVHQYARFSVYTKKKPPKKQQPQNNTVFLYARFVKKCCMQQQELHLRKNLEVVILRMKYLERYRYVFLFIVSTLTLNTKYSR